MCPKVLIYDDTFAIHMAYMSHNKKAANNHSQPSHKTKWLEIWAPLARDQSRSQSLDPFVLDGCAITPTIIKWPMKLMPMCA